MLDTTLDTMSDNASMEPIVEPKFTNETALEIVNKAEEKIQKAAKKRIAKPASGSKINDELINKVETFGVIGGFAMTMGGAPLTLATGYEIVALAVALSGIGSMLLTTGLMLTGRNKRVVPFVFRKHLQKKITTHEAEMRLWELKESEYKKAETKALTKAQPALDYLNSQMGTQEAVFSTTFRQEGLIVRDRKLKAIEKISLQVSGAAQEPTLKALTELTQKTPLSITQKEPANV